jgi:hypothetical protein
MPHPQTIVSPVGLVEVLAEYLLASTGFRWPGTDGATMEDVVRSAYPLASVSGWVPRPDELAERYPDLATEIGSFFAATTAA